LEKRKEEDIGIRSDSLRLDEDAPRLLPTGASNQAEASRALRRRDEKIVGMRIWGRSHKAKQRQLGFILKTVQIPHRCDERGADVIQRHPSRKKDGFESYRQQVSPRQKLAGNRPGKTL
jgi:hypothetical protein